MVRRRHSRLLLSVSTKHSCKTRGSRGGSPPTKLSDDVTAKEMSPSRQNPCYDRLPSERKMSGQTPCAHSHCEISALAPMVYIDKEHLSSVKLLAKALVAGTTRELEMFQFPSCTEFKLPSAISTSHYGPTKVKSEATVGINFNQSAVINFIKRYNHNTYLFFCQFCPG